MGLKGFFGNLLKGIATAIGTAIGGPIGGYVASTLFSIGESLVLGEPIMWDEFDPFSQFKMSTEQINLQKQQAENTLNQNLQNWFNSKIKGAWVNNFFGVLSSQNQTTNAYRHKLNTVILRLETLRLYYKGLETKSKAKGANISISEIIENEEIKSKAQFFSALIVSVRKAYEQNLKDEKILFHKKQLTDFKAHKYNLQGKAPENINFNFSAKTNVNLYVFNLNDDITVNYTDGSSATSEDINLNNSIDDPFSPIDTEINTEPTPATTATNQGYKTAGLWLVGLVGAGWLWKKLNNKSKPQNQ